MGESGDRPKSSPIGSKLIPSAYRVDGVGADEARDGAPEAGIEVVAAVEAAPGQRGAPRVVHSSVLGYASRLACL